MNLVEYSNTANTSATKNRTIKYIVIHYTAGTTSKSGTALSTAKYFSKETTKASADFIVDDETVVQYNPDIKNRYTWHCGGSKYKTKGGSLYKVCTCANSIGIEMCSTNSTKKVTNPNDNNWYFTDAVVNNCIELTKMLMEEYDIDAAHVIRHYDVNGKPCPGIVGWNEDTGDISKWMDFIIKVSPVPEPVVMAVSEEKATETVNDWAQETVTAAVPSVDPEEKPEPVKEEKPEKTKVTAKKPGILEAIVNFFRELFKK